MKYICKINKEDDYEEEDSKTVILDDDDMFTYTFWEKSYKKVYGKYPNEAIDLLYVSLFVFYLDRVLGRENSLDSWSRDIEVNFPVLELEKWNLNQKLLEDILEFLSGDRWHIVFRKRNLSKIEKEYLENINDKDNNIEVISMFSGGLDSFIGAIDILEGCKKAIFVSHYGGGKGTKEFQDYLRKILSQQYQLDDNNFFYFYATAKDGIEDTTRTRSFMFFSHAIAVASTLNRKITLIIPENGLISLNIPLTYSRLGTSSTRTTHPYYIKLFQELINRLGIMVDIKNPYQFKTKGEMIKDCKNINLLKNNINMTMSCSHPDVGRIFKETEAKHCGYCLPCLVRRAAIKAGIGHDITEYRDKDFKEYKVAKENLNSYMLGLKKYNPNNTIIKIQLSGKIEKNIDLYAGLYDRGMNELKRVLEEYYEPNIFS